MSGPDMAAPAPTCDDGVQNGEEQGIDCGPKCPKICDRTCPQAPEASRKRVFVTSEVIRGRILNDGAPHTTVDQFCQLAAQAAGLGGSWRAWISDTALVASTHVQEVGPWYLVDQCTLVTPDIATLVAQGPAVGLDTAEDGERFERTSYWTGTDAQGLATVFHCGDWARGAPSRFGVIGRSNLTGPGEWTEAERVACNQSHRVLCFEQ